MKISAKPLAILGLTVFSLAFFAWQLNKTPNEIDSLINAPAADTAALPTQQVNEKATKPVKKITKANGIMEQQLKGIAKQVSLISHYPPYSVPLDTNNPAYMKPGAFSPLSFPLPENLGKFRLELDRYIFHHPEPISGRFYVSGDNLERLNPTAWIQFADTKIPIQVTGNDEGVNREFSLYYQPNKQELATWPMDLQVVIELQLESKPLRYVTGFKYAKVVAKLTKVGTAFVEGSELKIPLTFEVMEKGRYRIQNNVYTSEGKPVAHGNTVADLSSSQHTAMLKLHISVLKPAGETQRYKLAEWNITKMPLPGQKTQFGISEKPAYWVNAFPLTDYIDEPYQDPKAAEKMAFLEKLGKLGNVAQ